LKGGVTDKLARLEAEIKSIKRRIFKFKDQINAATSIQGIFGTASALGLVPAFTIFVIVGALAALTIVGVWTRVINTELAAAEIELEEKNLQIAKCSERLDILRKVQQDFEIKISQNLDHISVGLGLLEIIWRKVSSDCAEIAAWLESSNADKAEAPPIMYAFLETGNTMYKVLAEALRDYGQGKYE
jgi:uncharacterized membrane protein YraQ (UPF0718 family)